MTTAVRARPPCATGRAKDSVFRRRAGAPHAGECRDASAVPASGHRRRDLLRWRAPRLAPMDAVYCRRRLDVLIIHHVRLFLLSASARPGRLPEVRHGAWCHALSQRKRTAANGGHEPRLWLSSAIAIPRASFAAMVRKKIFLWNSARRQLAAMQRTCVLGAALIVSRVTPARRLIFQRCARRSPHAHAPAYGA